MAIYTTAITTEEVENRFWRTTIRLCFNSLKIHKAKVDRTAGKSDNCYYTYFYVPSNT